MNTEKEIYLKYRELINAGLDKCESLFKENPEEILDAKGGAHYRLNWNFGMVLPDGKQLVFLISNHIVCMKIYNKELNSFIHSVTWKEKWFDFSSTKVRAMKLGDAIDNYRRHKEEYKAIRAIAQQVIDVEKILLEE